MPQITCRSSNALLLKVPILRTKSISYSKNYEGSYKTVVKSSLRVVSYNSHKIRFRGSTFLTIGGMTCVIIQIHKQEGREITHKRVLYSTHIDSRNSS